MQLGVVGLGRMGANIVRRLQRAGHHCVVYDVNPDAVALAQGLGLAPAFETARMYTGAIPPLRLERVFGVTTFELG